MEEELVNKVAASGLVTLDLADFLPASDEVVGFDLKEHLFMGLILKEKDFREALKHLDWKQYEGKRVGVHCSVDAIIPVWAYMLVASYLAPVAKIVSKASPDELRQQVMLDRLRHMDASRFAAQRVVVKGCGEDPIPEAAYLEITTKLRSFARSIMYGEPCSTVPIYKEKNG